MSSVNWRAKATEALNEINTHRHTHSVLQSILESNFNQLSLAFLLHGRSKQKHEMYQEKYENDHELYS